MAGSDSTERLRVAVDATPLLGDRTGVGVFTSGLLEALAARDDLELRGYGLTWAGRRQLAGLLPRRVRRCRLPMAAAPLLNLWRWLDGPVGEWWTGPVDVIHGTNFVVPPTRRAAQVVSVHDLTAIRFPELCNDNALAYPVMVSRALRRGAMVHTPSAAVATEVMEVFGLDSSRVRAVPLGFGAVGEVLAPSGAAEPAAAAAAAGPPYVLALGTVEPRKDFPTLVRAFDRVAADRDLELVIAGPVGWGEHALTEAIGASRFRSRIRRLGWVAEAERSALLRGAAVFAFPSLYEGFGLPPLEAMAAGVPVVATDGGAVPEVVGDAALLVPVGDEAALAGALARVLDDDSLRNRLVAAGAERIAGFTWERCAEGMVQLYRDAVSSV
jgi:glycosyltransferase involved in cell wall biosynthesis